MMKVGVKKLQRGWGSFSVGFLLGILLTLVLAGGILYSLPGWLVIEAEPVGAKAVVVLGGGGGSRLREGLALIEEELSYELILVGKNRSDWDYIVKQLCLDCSLKGKKVIYLTGSQNTITDAELTLKHCRKYGLDSILVVTDPYHTRRADLVFQKTFRGIPIDVRIVSSCDYGLLLPPDKNWWHDRKTLETVWQEIGKCVYVLFGDL